MSWSSPITWISAVVTAAQMNQQIRDNELELRQGGIAISGQAAGDFIRASSATQFTRNTLAQVLALVYPVGSLYFNAGVSTNPATLLGFGTWTAWGAGRVPVGFDVTQAEFDALEETGGTKTHTLTTAEMPSHSHNARTTASPTAGFSTWNQSNAPIVAADATEGNGGSNVVTLTGGGGAHNNLQPYITTYIWKRTA